MLKKILALTVATVMVVSMGLMSFAATNNRALDGSMTVRGLEDGDVVTFYQILKFDQNASGTGGWVTGDGYSGTIDEDEIKRMIGSGTNPQMGITYADAQAIAGSLSGSAYTATASGTTFVTFPSDQPGLYIAIITPSKAGVVYNPVFVANDYNQPSGSSGSNTWELVEGSGSYSDGAVAKKKTLTLTKEITNQTGNNDSGTTHANTQPTGPSGVEPDATNNSFHSANLDDVISFKISTIVPAYGHDYTNPTFNVYDKLDGLILDSGSIQVLKDESGTPALDASGTYSISSDTDNFTVTFDPEYLLQARPAQSIIIVYNATIDPSGTANFNVNEKDNEVTVKYSNKPGESGSSESGTLRDRTKNYVFSIDADILGGGSWIESGTEIVKVALDADGNEVWENSGTYLNSGTDPVGALEGAVFTWKAKNNTAQSGTVESDADGRLKIWGIDAGEYLIKETTAPDGYVIDPHEYNVKIVPTLEKVDYFDEEEGIRYTYDRLISYDVYVDEVLSAHYTMNDSGTDITCVSGTFEVSNNGPIRVSGTGAEDSGSRIGKIQNTQGVALPSTGGIGTTLFYAGGAVLVLLAGVLLVSKRRIA